MLCWASEFTAHLPKSLLTEAMIGSFWRITLVSPHVVKEQHCDHTKFVGPRKRVQYASPSDVRTTDSIIGTTPCILNVTKIDVGRVFSHPFLSPAHEVGAGGIVITTSGLASVRPCFVSGRYIGNR